MNIDFGIKHVEFKNFRNYTSFEINDLKRLVIIVGDNAQGKTNIIEGIQLVSMIDSFRKPLWDDVIRKGSKKAQILVKYHQNGCDNSIALQVSDNKRSYQVNEKSRRSRDLLGLLPAVLFTPSDLQIVQGSADRRRSCIDDLGCQISKTFNDIKQDYTRVVKQKNSLLREDYVNVDILASWDRNLVKLGVSLMSHRTALFERLMKKTQAIYHKLAPTEELTIEYISSWKSECKNDPDFLKNDLLKIFTQAVEEKRAEEIRRKRVLIGPHRDEISFYINKNDARRFGSQGQQRSIALALKIAEVELLREITGADPLLLLDDVMSEIDESRRTILLDLIDTATQTFITTTNLTYFDERALQRAQIIRLPFETVKRSDKISGLDDGDAHE